MINTKKIYVSIFITSIVFIMSIFLTGMFFKSELWHDLVNIEVGFFELFNNFVFYIVSDLLGLAIIIYFTISFINKAKTSADGIAILKNKIHELKKELIVITVLVVIVFIGGIFIEQVKYFNVLFIPFSLIIIMTATVFIALMEKYVLST